MIRRREFIGMLGAAATLKAADVKFPKGAVIRTVLKDISPESLAGGATLFHEHMSLAADFMPRWIAFSRQGRGGNNAPPAATPDWFMNNLDTIVDEMKAAKEEGVACITDGGHPDMGRDFNFLKQVSEKSGMPIVAGGGLYSDPFYPAEVKEMAEEQIVKQLVDQAKTTPIGVYGEIGSWDEITDTERKVFRAIAKAHRETNLSIFTHTGIPGKSAIEQLDILEGGGVKPERIVIGHLGNLVDNDVKVHKEICRRGAFIGFDRQGGAGDTRQVPMVLALVEAGYARNLMFSSDLSSAAQIKKNKGAGYAKTVTVWGKALRDAGMTEDVLHGILVDNPRRFLACVPKFKRA